MEDIRKTADIHVCASLGMLDEEDFIKLHEAGMTMVHNNMEASDAFFKTLCTTHTSDDKRKSIRAAKAAGMKVCSGGLIGLGETLLDRIDLAFSLRELDVDSVPINMLNPIPGTYFEHQEPMKQEEFLRTVAVFRFLGSCREFSSCIQFVSFQNQPTNDENFCFQSQDNIHSRLANDPITYT